MGRSSDMQEERLAWLHLARAVGVGPVRHRRLVEQFGSARQALVALREATKRRETLIHGKIVIPARREIEEEWFRVHDMGGSILTLLDDAYPPQLALINQAPLVLTVLGRKELLQRQMVGVVGSRHPSLNSSMFIEKLARALAEHGFVVVSGMAHGIDSAAHKGALSGGTVAVLACGVDVVYPPENERLYRQLSDVGALLSEEALGAPPHAKLFPKRNRIIAGLSLGLVVMDAKARSGSLITADYALSYHREIFAVPGSPQDPRSYGANFLIQQGAVLVSTVDDILRHITARQERMEQSKDVRFLHQECDHPVATPLPSGKALVDMRRSILSLLDAVPLAMDIVIEKSACPPSHVAYILLELDLEGRLEYHQGNKVSLVM